MVCAIFVAWKLTKLCIELCLCSILLHSLLMGIPNKALTVWLTVTRPPTPIFGCIALMHHHHHTTKSFNEAFWCITWSIFNLQNGTLHFEIREVKVQRSHKYRVLSVRSKNITVPLISAVAIFIALSLLPSTLLILTLYQICYRYALIYYPQY
jgi:hypothetical protein